MDCLTRLSLMTLNAWHKRGAAQNWPARRTALTTLMRTVRPDVLCLQECSAEVLGAVDEALPHHERVRDSFRGATPELPPPLLLLLLLLPPLLLPLLHGCPCCPLCVCC